MMENRDVGALKDLKMIELGHLIAGPFCGQLMADHGVEVIKVESPGAGDPMREWGRGKPVWWPVIGPQQEVYHAEFACLRRPGNLEGTGGHERFLGRKFPSRNHGEMEPELGGAPPDQPATDIDPRIRVWPRPDPTRSRPVSVGSARPWVACGRLWDIQIGRQVALACRSEIRWPGPLPAWER